MQHCICCLFPPAGFVNGLLWAVWCPGCRWRQVLPHLWPQVASGVGGRGILFRLSCIVQQLGAVVSVEQCMCYRSHSKHPVHRHSLMCMRRQQRRVNSGRHKKPAVKKQKTLTAFGVTKTFVRQRDGAVYAVKEPPAVKKAALLACRYVGCTQTSSHAPALAAHKDKHIRRGILWCMRRRVLSSHYSRES